MSNGLLSFKTVVVKTYCTWNTLPY